MPTSPYLKKPLRSLAEAAAAVEKARADAFAHCKPEAGEPKKERRAKASHAARRQFHPKRKAS